VPHGVDWQEWQHEEENQGFILYNKNRVGDVCHPSQMQELAVKFPSLQFVSTFSVPNVSTPSNVKVIGLLSHGSMKKVVQRCGVYLSVTKETFAIGVLEAMAAGKPVLGWNYGGNSDLVKHGINGYLAEPGDMNDLAEGLWYTLKNAQTLGENGREIARDYTWERAVKQVTDIYRLASEDKFADRSMFIEPSSYRTELP
jgi:glycosyltransferase involved in cell wall biosynthesis